MLLARGMGSSIAAYFSSVDSYSTLAHEYSNEHEMIFLNADNIKLDENLLMGYWHMNFSIDPLESRSQ
jgi:hypothetical protein